MKSEKIYYIILAVLSEEASDEEMELFNTWYHASDTNKAEYNELKRLHDRSLRSPKKTIAFDSEEAWNKLQHKTIQKRSIYNKTAWIGIAATLLLVASLGSYLYKRSNTDNFNQVALTNLNIEELAEPTLILSTGKQVALTESDSKADLSELQIEESSDKKLTYKKNQSKEQSSGKSALKTNRLIIPVGKTYELNLADGTRVKLNSRSELIYPDNFTEQTREVTLIGEAYFDVAKDASKPFIVKANGIDVKVLGTSFNVSCYEKQSTIETTLVEGKVAVILPDRKEEVITPSQQLVFDKAKQTSATATVDTRIYTSWINNKLIFKNERIDVILAKLQYWYDFEIEYDNESIKENRFSLEIDKNTDLNKILDLINFTSNIKLIKTDHKITLKHVKEVHP
ncbi:MAG: FecR family protein [Tannerellaceae bacterium]